MVPSLRLDEPARSEGTGDLITPANFRAGLSPIMLLGLLAGTRPVGAILLRFEGCSALGFLLLRAAILRWFEGCSALRVLLLGSR
jgi:hypothetical protein